MLPTCPLVSLCKEYLNTGTERNILTEQPWLTFKVCMGRIQCAKVALLECFVLSRYHFKTTRFRTIETSLVRRHVGVTFTLNSGQ